MPLPFALSLWFHVMWGGAMPAAPQTMAMEAQAVDRAHRIGQDKTVMVYRLVAAGTIEEKVMALKERKRDLFARVLDDDGGAPSGALTADDVRSLFA